MSEEERKFLEIVDLKKGFGSGETRQEVLRGMNFSVAKGEFCVLLGPSGSGKSTLLNIIGGIDSADSGYISINGDKLKDMSEKKVVSTEQGEVAKQIVEEYNELWNSRYALSFESFYEEYKERYQIIKRQREIAKSEETPSIEKYRLKPNAMQVGFITNLRKILEKGEDMALLISATGERGIFVTGGRNPGFTRVSEAWS